MKINEVESLAGITKKNIRFYEEQGLLSPRRNKENGYREYGGEDVRVLRRIKLLRKLGLPIEEIRRLFAGEHTLGDAMRRHLVSLERESENIRQAMEVCTSMRDMDIPVTELDEEAVLKRMEAMERGGTFFRDKQKQDVRVDFVAPILASVLMVLLMLGLSALVIWAYINEPEGAPPMFFIVFVLLCFAAVAVGVLLALQQRLKEIVKGEMDDAKRY